MKMWEKCGWKWSGPFRVRFLPDNLTFKLAFHGVFRNQDRTYIRAGLHTHPHKHTHTYIHTHTHTHTHTQTYSRYYHLRIVMALLVGYEFKKCISLKIQTRPVSAPHYALYYKEKSGNESSYTKPSFWQRNILTYLLSPWSRVLLEKLPVSQLVKKFPAFYGTRRSITALTSANHLSLSSARSIQSMLHHPTS